LVSGTYSLSIWFGDSVTNYFEGIDVLSLVINNNASLGRNLGSYYPKVEYINVHK